MKFFIIMKTALGFLPPKLFMEASLDVMICDTGIRKRMTDLPFLKGMTWVFLIPASGIFPIGVTMGYRELEFALPTDYTADQLAHKIRKTAGTADFSYSIIRKSLDARKKNNILWRIRVLAKADCFKGALTGDRSLEIPRCRREESVLVAGSGPAGFFAAYVLLLAGFKVSLIERGLDVDARSSGIDAFEAGGDFNPKANYAFGEGGAGTFSDGKLTSRTKSIKAERNFIFDSYIKAGAPEEIRYLTHPHLGTDNLKLIVKKLRDDFESLGGKIIFNCMLSDLEIKGTSVKSAETSKGKMDFDYLFIAPGHSSFETYRMLIRRGISFRNKKFCDRQPGGASTENNQPCPVGAG